jgi:chromosome segregation ATPase
MGLVRIAQLEERGDRNITSEVQQEDTTSSQTNLQSAAIEHRIAELEAAHEHLKGTKEEFASQFLAIRAQTSQMDQVSETRSRIEDLEWALEKHAARLREISQFGQTESKRTDESEYDEVLSLRQPSASGRCETMSKCHDLRQTRGQVEALEQTVVDQASSIMSMASRLAGDLSELETSGCTIRDRVGRLSARAECLKGELCEHEVDLTGLKNVCAALYSQKTALELDATSESSLALLATLAKRFPLCASGDCENSGGDFWEPVD